MKLKILTVPVLIAVIITTASAQYERTDLVSNQPGVAPNTDPHLVNAWGLVALPTSPWWVSDNVTGDSSLYNAAGQLVIASGGTTNFVTVPPAPSSPAGTLGHADRYRRKYQPHRERLYRHGRRQIGPIDFYLRHTRRYDQRLESHSRLS
jgi:hypothetical protein